MPHENLNIDQSKISREFTLLSQMSSILSSSLNLKDTLSTIFDLLSDEIGFKLGILSLVDANADLNVEMAYGLSEKQLQQHTFKKWQVVSQEVLDTDSAQIRPLLDRGELGDIKKSDFIEEECLYVCLPISMSGERVGTLGVSWEYTSDENFNRRLHLYSIMTLMIGQEVKLKHLMESEKEALKHENKQLKHELKEKYNIHNMIGTSGSMIEIYENISKVADSNATVLIRGESGTGKELVAHAIHYNSPRADKPFIRINCGAIPESLIESELFGYEKGAFTDAQSRKIGRFEAADGGSIFLDEVGELSPIIQVKLLRVLQEKEFTRIGGVEPTKANVRVITATNRDLEAELKEGKFREDLYYRLNVFPIFMPPLRDRRADIILLADHFLGRYCEENAKDIKRISSLAIDLLSSYNWPGNVRELENCIERAVIMCDADSIQVSHLPASLQRSESLIIASSDHLTLQDMVSNFERELIMDALKESKGNRSKVARLLGTTQRIIGYKIKQLGIHFSK